MRREACCSAERTIYDRTTNQTKQYYSTKVRPPSKSRSEHPHPTDLHYELLTIAISTYRTLLSALRMHSTMHGYRWLSHSTMRATAVVRQRTDTDNCPLLPAQSTLRVAGITYSSLKSNLTPRFFASEIKTTHTPTTSLEDGLNRRPVLEYGYG